MNDERNYINPFEEEFDENDVVNRPKPFEDFAKVDPKDENVGKKVIADIISDGDNLHIKTIEDDDEDEVYGLIKKEDIESGKHLLEEIEDFNTKYKPQVHNIDNTTETQKTNEPQLVEFKRPEEEIQEYLQNNFKDYIVIPKISGSSKKFSEKNLLHKDEVKPTGKKVEIVDHIPSGINPKQKTSILINRDVNGEIESIEVICKCGERTLITFDYSDISDDESNLTEVIGEPKETVPFDKLHTLKENIFIVNPDILIEDLKKVEGIIDEEEQKSEINENDQENDEEFYDDMNLDEFEEE